MVKHTTSDTFYPGQLVVGLDLIDTPLEQIYLVIDVEGVLIKVKNRMTGAIFKDFNYKFVPLVRLLGLESYNSGTILWL